MRSQTRVVLPLLLIAALPVCGREPRRHGGSADGGGGRVVVVADSAALRWKPGQEWRVAEPPLLDLGDEDGGDPARQFDRVAGAVRLSDGTLVVADGGSRQLRFFRADGTHLRSAGGRGNGPGEFGDLSWVGSIAGDSVAAWDATNRRISLFDREGRFARAVTLDVGGIAPRLHGVFSGGVAVVTPGWTLAPPGAARPGETRDTMLLLAFDLRSSRTDTLARIPGAETFVIASGAGVSTYPIPFGRESLVAVAGDAWFVGDTGERRVVERSRDGRPGPEMRWRGEPIPVRDQDVAAYHAARKRDLSFVPASLRARLAAREAEERRALPHRATLPAFSALLAPSGGGLWVREARRPADPRTRWQVFAPGGTWLGRMETPPGVTVLQAGDRWMLGLARDEMDVEHVRLYRIERPSNR